MVNLQVVDHLLKPFQPMDAQAKKLLELGIGLRERTFISGPHIVLAALHQHDLMATLHGAKHFRALAETLRQNGVAASLQHWIDFPSDHSDTEYWTYGLVFALAQAREIAGTSVISWQLLLQAIVQHDIDVVTAIATVSHDTANPNFTISLPRSWPSNSWNNSFSPSVMPDAMYLPTRREATTALLYENRHRLDIEETLEKLAHCAPNQVLVVRGLFGSPRQRLYHILADILVHPSGDPARQKFAELHHVLYQDISTLHAASMQEPNGAVINLRYSLGLARSLHAILVLTRGELLTNPQFRESNMQILSTLLQINNIPIVISYEDIDEWDSAEDIHLPLISFHVVPMKPYLRQHALNAIHVHYENYWRSRGVQIEQDALDTFFQMERAIYAYSDGILKRKALPYSAADTLNAAVDTILGEVAPGGSGLLQARALTARDTAKTLLQSPDEGTMLFAWVESLSKVAKSQTDDQDLRTAAKQLYEDWRPICEMLGSLPAKMQALADNPQVRKSTRSLYTVTQDMVTAQLLTDAECRLRLMKAFEVSVRLSEPRLLDLIQNSYENA